MIRKRARGTSLYAKRPSIAEVAGHGPPGNGMKHRSAVRAGIETGFAADAPLFVCHDGAGIRDALPGPGGANGHAGRFFTVLTDNGHENGDLFPFLHSYP